MRVGLIIYGSLDAVSGGYLYDRMLVAHLRSRGDQVEILSLPWRDYGRHLSDNLSWSWLRQLCQTPMDVLLQDELNHPSLVWLNRRLRDQIHAPLIGIVHHLRSSEVRQAWQNRLYRWVERHYLTTLDGFVCNSYTTQAAVERLIGAKQAVVVAPPGRDQFSPTLTVDQITARARQAGPLRVLFVGNLIPRKELHTLLAGLATLPQASWQLDVVGSLTANPAYVQAIRQQISRLGLAQQVTLLGALDDAELAAWFVRSHLLAVPSSYEGFGIVYVEGMGFGLPAMASTAGAAGELITHGQNGFLVPPGDAAAVARHVSALCQDRQRLLQMSLAAYKGYATHPTWAETAEAIREFLYTVIRE